MAGSSTCHDDGSTPNAHNENGHGLWTRGQRCGLAHSSTDSTMMTITHSDYEANTCPSLTVTFDAPRRALLLSKRGSLSGSLNDSATRMRPARRPKSSAPGPACVPEQRACTMAAPGPLGSYGGKREAAQRPSAATLQGPQAASVTSLDQLTRLVRIVT